MKLVWNKDYLDFTLVPAGLLVMFGYHLFLLRRYLKYPQSTALGFENHCKKAWVKKMTQIDSTNRGDAFSVISTTISAATGLASISLALGSFIGAWIGSSKDHFVSKIIYGDTKTSVVSIKYISILLCFLLAFTLFIQCASSYVHVNFLLSMPNTEVPDAYVIEALVSGANFWQLGLRAIYFAITLMFWMFGPIPMFLSSVVTVLVLLVLDGNEKPLHDFSKTGKNLLKKVEDEISAMTTAFEHNAPHSTEVTTSVTATMSNTTSTTS